jgi:hypothetical protein
MKGVPLGLHRFIPSRDVRKLVWRHLTPADRAVVRLAHNNECTIDSTEWWSIIRECGKYQYVVLLHWVLDYGFPLTHYHDVVIVETLARVGDGKTLGKLHLLEKQLACACRGAARGGHRELLDWLFARSRESNFLMSVCEAAVAGGHMDLFFYCFRRTEYRVGAFYYVAVKAAKHGLIPILAFIVARDRSDQDTWKFASESAAKHAQLDVVEWLRARGLLDVKAACFSAVRHGRVSVLKWMERHVKLSMTGTC